MLAKPDFINIAVVIRRIFDACDTPEERVRVHTVAQAQADHFASESRGFELALFRTNCGALVPASSPIGQQLAAQFRTPVNVEAPTQKASAQRGYAWIAVGIAIVGWIIYH